MKLGRIEVSCSALLVIALLYYFDSDGVLGWVLAAGLLHELGHWLAIRWMGGRVRALRLSFAGAEMRLSAARTLSPGQRVLAALAGPVANLLVAGGSIWLARHGMGEKLYFFAGIDLGLAWFNLLPVSWLDGGRALEGLLVCLGREELGGAAAALISKVVLALTLWSGLFLLWQSEGRNFTLLIAGLWMMGAADQREPGRASRKPGKKDRKY